MISIVVAIGNNNVIGKNNELPWYYPEDLKYFKKITTGKTVVMGRVTFESIVSRNGKALPNRKNIVITKDNNFKYDDVVVVNNINDFITNLEEDVYIIGGSQIYDVFLPHTDRLYITHVNKDFEGDTFFPEIDYSKFELVGQDNQGDLSFCVYQRRP